MTETEPNKTAETKTQNEKVAPETLELRARPQPVTRINRKVVFGGAAAVLLLVSFLVLVALQPPKLQVGTPRELIASLGAGHVVEFAFDGSGAIDERTLGTLAGVMSARHANGTWALQVTAAHQTIPLLLDVLAQRGLPLTGLSTHSPTLEDVFVTLTGRSLRDDA